MDRRTEPRFSIASRVKVTLLSSLDRQIDCRMVDLSATGMRFIANETIPLDEIVAVDFEDHLAVANVRNCQRYGDKFSVGTSRIHSLPKDELPAGKPQYEQIRVLLEEKGWLVEIETGDTAPDTPAGPIVPTEAEAAQAEVTPVAKDVAPEEQVATVPEGTPPTEVLAQTEAAAVAEAGEVAPVTETPFVAAPPPDAMPAPTLVETVMPLVAPEAEDPVSLQLDAPPAPQSAPQSERGSRRGLIAVAVLVLLIVAGALVLRPRHPAATRDTVAAAAPEAPSVPAEQPPAPPTAKHETAAPGSNVHQVHLSILNPAWVSATADGKAVLGKMLAKGDSNEFQFSRVAFVHLGNSSGVEITLDGKPLQLVGDSGPLRLVQITPDGGRILPWTNGDPASPLEK